MLPETGSEKRPHLTHDLFKPKEKEDEEADGYTTDGESSVSTASSSSKRNISSESSSSEASYVSNLSVETESAGTKPASIIFKPIDLTLSELQETEQGIIEGESISSIDLTRFCQECAKEDLSYIPSLDTLIYLIRRLEETTQVRVETEVEKQNLTIAFNELLQKKPLIAAEILKRASTIWENIPKEKAKEAIQLLHLSYRRLPPDLKNDPSFFYQVTEKLKSSGLFTAFNQEVLGTLIRKDELSPNIATAWDNIGETRLADEDALLEDYCHYLLKHPDNPSKEALKKLAKRLGTDEGYAKFGDLYGQLLEKPSLAATFVLTPELLYELSVRYPGRKAANRENRVIRACNAYLQSGLPSDEVITKLAYDLLTSFSAEPLKIKVIFDTLRDPEYAKTPHLTELVGRPRSITKKTQSGKLRDTMKSLIGINQFADIPKQLQNPNIVKALWFQKGKMLLDAAGKGNLNDTQIYEIKHCFEKAFEAEKTEELSSTHSHSDDTIIANSEQQGELAFLRESMRDAPIPTLSNQFARSVEAASNTLSEEQLKGIVAVLLKTTLPQHDSLWQFFSGTTQDTIYDEDERLTLILYLLDALFPSDRSKTPAVDASIWSKAMEFLLAQIDFLTSTENNETELEHIREKIDSLRGITAENENWSDKITDLFKDKPVTSLHKVIFSLMRVSAERAVPQAVILLNQLITDSERNYQINAFIRALIKPAEPEIIQKRIDLLVKLLMERSLPVTTRLQILSNLRTQILSISDDIERSSELDPHFVALFLNTAVHTMENAIVDPQILRLLLPEKWPKLEIEWKDFQTLANFMVNTLNQQHELPKATIDFLNKINAPFRFMVLNSFIPKGSPEGKLSFLLQIKINDFSGKQILDLLKLIFRHLTQDEIVARNEWAALKNQLVHQIQNLSAEDITRLESTSLFQNGLEQWPQLEAGITTYLKDNPSKEHLLNLLPIEKQKTVIQHWLQNEVPIEQLNQWIKRFDYASRLAFIHLPSIQENNKKTLQKILLCDPQFYASSEISDEQFKDLYALEITASDEKAEDIIRDLLASNELNLEQEEMIYLRILGMTATAITTSEHQARAYLNSVYKKAPLSWRVLQKDDAITKERLKEIFSKAQSFNKYIILYHLSQAILAYANTQPLVQGSYARELTTSLDFWLSYANKSQSFRPQREKLTDLLEPLEVAELKPLFSDTASRIAELKALDSAHLQEILLVYAESVKKYPELLDAFSQTIAKLYLENSSIFEASKLLTTLEQLGLDNTIAQNVLKILMKNGTLSRSLAETDNLDDISDKNLNHWLSVLSDDEQRELYNTRTNLRLRNFINLQQLKRLETKITIDTLPNCVDWTMFLEDKKPAVDFFTSLGEHLNHELLTSFIQTIDKKCPKNENQTADYIKSLFSAISNITGEMLGQWYQEAISHVFSQQSQGVIQWLQSSATPAIKEAFLKSILPSQNISKEWLDTHPEFPDLLISLAHNDQAILEVFKVLNDEQKIQLLEHADMLENFSDSAVNNILALITDPSKRETFCISMLMKGGFETTPNLEKHGYSLAKHLSSEQCKIGFDNSVSGFDPNKQERPSASELKRIRRFGIMLLRSEEGLKLLLQSRDWSDGNPSTRLDRFQRLMLGYGANKLDNPFWFTADMIENIPGQLLKSVFQHLLSLDEQHLQENNFTIDNIFHAIETENYKQNSVGTLLLLQSLVEYLTDQLKAQAKDGLPLLSLREIQHIQEKLDSTWEYLSASLNSLSLEQWASLPQETQLSLLTLLSDKITNFSTLYETTTKATTESSGKLGKFIQEKEMAEGRELSQAEVKELIDNAPETLGIRQNIKRIQNVEWPLFQKISPLYGQFFIETFTKDSPLDLNTPDGAAYWQFCITQLPKIQILVLEDPKSHDCQSLIEDSVQLLFVSLLQNSAQSNSAEKWKEFQQFFEAIRGKNTLNGFALIGLIDGLNNSNIKQFVNSIPLESLDWLIHQVADETELKSEIFATLIHRYVAEILAGHLTLDDVDKLFERKMIATEQDVRFAIHQAIAENGETIAQHPERLPANLRKFFIRHCDSDGVLNPQKRETVEILATLLELPEFLYSETQKTQIQQLTSKKDICDAIITPMEEWATKIEKALFGLTSDDRSAVLPLFQALLSYYAEDLVTLKSELRDDGNIILDKFVEISDKIAVFFGTTIDKLLESCDTKTKLAFVDEAFSGQKARRLVEMQPACPTLSGIKFYRKAFFGDTLLEIPDNSRSLSYADGDLWHVFYIGNTKEWAVIGRCPNNMPPGEPAVIEFLARFSDKPNASISVQYWDETTKDYVPYLTPETWQETLGKGTTQCLNYLAIEVRSIKFKEHYNDEQKQKVMRDIIQEAPSLSQSRRQRSERVIQQWMDAATKLTDNNSFKQAILKKIVERNALDAISPELGKAVIAQIKSNPVNPISVQGLDQNEREALENLYRLREEYVFLTDWITNPVNIAALNGQTKLTFADCIQALRERLPVLVKVGKDQAEHNRKEYQKELKELQSKKDADFEPPSALIWLNENDLVIGKFYINSSQPIPEEVIEELEKCSAPEDFISIFQKHRITTAAALALPAKFLLVRTTKDNDYTVEITQDGYNQGQVFVSKKDVKLLETPSINLDREIQRRHLQAKIDRETWNVQRAKQFSADDHLIIVINRLRENIQEIARKNLGVAQEANQVISHYLNSEYHDQRTAKTITAWLTRGIEDAIRAMIGGDIAQCESVLSQFLSKHRFNVAKTWNRQKAELPEQSVYIYQNGKLVPIGRTQSGGSNVTGDTREYTLEWKAGHETTAEVCQYYQAMRECDLLEAEREKIQRLIIQRNASKNSLYLVPYGYLPKALEEINAKIAQKQALPVPAQESIDQALKPGQTLYDQHGKCIGVLNTNLCLEQDLLYGEDAWYQILVSQSLDELLAAESAINVAVLNVIQRGFLPDLLLEKFSSDKSNFLLTRIQKVILEIQPFLSHKDCKNLVSHFSTEALLQFMDAYNRPDKESQETRQALVSSLLTSPRHLSYFVTTEERQLTLWKYLTKSGFSKEDMLKLLQALTTDSFIRPNPHTVQLSQLVRAAYFFLSNPDAPDSVPNQLDHSDNQIQSFRIEQLPVSIVKVMPQEIRKRVFQIPENFQCLQKSQYFQSLSHDLPPQELREIFRQFLRSGFNLQHNSCEGIVTFYRNLDEKVFWTIFNETIPTNSPQRKQWIQQGMFGNPAFMQAVSENLGENSVAKLAYRDVTKVTHSIGEQLGLLEKLSDRYSAFSIDEIIQLVDHYKEHPSEEVQTFLADWLFLQLQSGQLTLTNDSAANDQEYLDALVWDEKGGIELLELGASATKEEKTPQKIGIQKIQEAHLNSLLSLVGNPAFAGMMTAKYALTKSNLETLIKEKARRDTADFATFYDHVVDDETGQRTQRFSLQAAETTINLSVEGAYQNRAWVPVKAIDHALLESARQAQEKNTATPKQREKWKKLLDDYVGSLRYALDKKPPFTPEELHSQFTEVRKTVARLFYNRDFMPHAAADTLDVMLKRENFLLLMKMYNDYKDKHNDENKQKVCYEIIAILGAMYISNPTKFLSELSAFDRKKEWQFAVETLELNKMLEGKTDQNLEKELRQARKARRNAIGETIVASTLAGAAVGTVATAAGIAGGKGPMKGAMVGLMAGLVGGLAIEVEGRVEAGARYGFHTIRDAVTAAYNGISRDEQNKARTIFQDRQFEEGEQCKKRTGKFWGKSGFASGWRRLEIYRPDVSWFARPLYAVGVYFGLVPEPRSDLKVESFREKMPTVYIGTEQQHSIRGDAILLTPALGNSYECRFYENGQCTNSANVTTISLGKEAFGNFLKDGTVLSGQSVAKGDRASFGQMLEKIEVARNEAILGKESNAKKDYYNTSRTLVQEEQMGKATHQAIQQDPKNFSALRKRLLIIPRGLDSKQNQANARMNESSLRAAINLVNLMHQEDIARVSLDKTYSVSNGFFSRLWNGLTGWYTGNQLIEREDVQKLKHILNELLHNDPVRTDKKTLENSILANLVRHDDQQTTRESYLSLPQNTASILSGEKPHVKPQTPITENSSTLLEQLTANMEAQRIITKNLISRLNKNIAEGNSLTQTLADLERSLSASIKMATRVHALNQGNLHREVEEVLKQCQQIHTLIKTQASVTEKLQNMMSNITYECSHTAERLLLRRLDNLQSALESSPQSSIRNEELNAIKKEQWNTCKTILEVYPEDTQLRAKFDKLSSDLKLSKDLDCEVGMRKEHREPSVAHENVSNVFPDIPKPSINETAKLTEEGDHVFIGRGSH